MSVAVLPWQQALLDDTPVAAATLVTGAAGVGAGGLALALAHRFCGDVVSTGRSGGGAANPDLLITLPEKQNIPVAAIRHLSDFLSLAPVSRVRRVAVVLRADRLHQSAANALLKTLEEPLPNKALLLWAPMLQQLPATIISRCRIVRAPTPPDNAAAGDSSDAMLAFCGQQPLATADYPPDWCDTLANHLKRGAKLNIGDAIAAFNISHDSQPQWQQAVADAVEAGAHLNPHCLDWAENDSAAGEQHWLAGLQKWVSDGVRVACALPPQFFPPHADALHALAAHNKRGWLNFHRDLLDRRALAGHPLVRDLFIRETLYAYRRLCAN